MSEFFCKTGEVRNIFYRNIRMQQRSSSFFAFVIQFYEIMKTGTGERVLIFRRLSSSDSRLCLARNKIVVRVGEIKHAAFSGAFNITGVSDGAVPNGSSRLEMPLEFPKFGKVGVGARSAGERFMLGHQKVSGRERIRQKYARPLVTPPARRTPFSRKLGYELFLLVISDKQQAGF